MAAAGCDITAILPQQCCDGSREKIRIRQKSTEIQTRSRASRFGGSDRIEPNLDGRRSESERSPITGLIFTETWKTFQSVSCVNHALVF